MTVRRGRTACHPVHHQLGGKLPYPLEVLEMSREVPATGYPSENAVKANDRHLLGHLDLTILKHLTNLQGDVVVDCKNGSWSIFECEASLEGRFDTFAHVN